MTFFGFQDLSEKLLIAFAAAIFLTVTLGLIKILVMRRRLRIAAAIVTARSCSGSRSGVTPTHNRAENIAQLFGIRALEAGVHGGIVPADKIPRQSSAMRQLRLSLIRSFNSSRIEHDQLPVAGIESAEYLNHRGKTVTFTIDIGEIGNLQSIQTQLTPPNDSKREPVGLIEGFAFSSPLEPTQLSSSPFSPIKFRSHSVSFNKPLPPLPSSAKSSRIASSPAFKFESLDDRQNRRARSLPSSLRRSSSELRRAWNMTRNRRPWQGLPFPTLSNTDGAMDFPEGLTVQPQPLPATQSPSEPSLISRYSQPGGNGVMRRSDIFDQYGARFSGYTIPSPTKPPSRRSLSVRSTLQSAGYRYDWGFGHQTQVDVQ